MGVAAHAHQYPRHWNRGTGDLRHNAASARADVESPPVSSRPVSELLADLTDGDASSKAAAAFALANAGKVSPDVVEALVAALDEPGEHIREGAAWALFHVKGPGFQYDNLFDSLPKMKSHPRPNYPQAAFVKGIQGTVKLRILINALGQVVHVAVEQSIPGLDSEAIRAIRHWTFEPAVRGGRPVPAAIVSPVAFRISP